MNAIGATAGEVAYRAIRADIIFGRLAPSCRIRLEEARARYGVSVSTLREILNRLSSEGFVVAEGQRGFQVAPVSPEGFREVASLRLLLECHGLATTLVQGDIEWEGRVVAAHHKLSVAEARMEAGHRSMSETWKRYDREFHRAVISACGSEVLMDTHAAVYDQYLRYQMIAVIYRGQVAAREHRELFEAVMVRDFPLAVATLTRHIEDCVADALSRPNGPWIQPKAGPPRRVAARLGDPKTAAVRSSQPGRRGTGGRPRTRRAAQREP